MDIQELLRREQASLANMAHAACSSSRWSHAGLARRYRKMLSGAGVASLRPMAIAERPVAAASKTSRIDRR